MYYAPNRDSIYPTLENVRCNHSLQTCSHPPPPPLFLPTHPFIKYDSPPGIPGQAKSIFYFR